MLQSHFVVLAERPSVTALGRLEDGYQLFRESRTGLYYLTAWSQPPAQRPDFQGWLARAEGRRVDLSALQCFMAEARERIAMRPHEVRLALIGRAATLSALLEGPVLVIEENADDYAMAAMVERGALAYLRFHTTSAAPADRAAALDVIYRPESGFRVVERAAADGAEIAATAISDAFGIVRPRLFNYAEPKPSRAEARLLAGPLQVTVQEYLDSYGVFRRIGLAPPRTALPGRGTVRLRRAGSLVVLPFILVATVALALLYSGRPQADPRVTGARLFWLGLAIVALPVLAVLGLIHL